MNNKITISIVLVSLFFVAWVHCPALSNKCPVLIVKDIINK